MSNPDKKTSPAPPPAQATAAPMGAEMGSEAGAAPSRRRAIAIGGTAAIAAIGAIIGVHAAFRTPDAGVPLEVSCEIAPAPSGPVGADVVDISDAGALASHGISFTNAQASAGLERPERAPREGGAARYARLTAKGLRPGAAYMATVVIRSFSPLEGRRVRITGLVDSAKAAIVARGDSAEFDVPFLCDGEENLKATSSMTLLETV